ncbi:MAG: HD domain-containing protein [Pseudomonadota bacterium]
MKHPIDIAPELLCDQLLALRPEMPRLASACALTSEAWDGDLTRPRGPRVAQILAGLNADETTLLTALLGDPRLQQRIDDNALARDFGAPIAHRLEELRRLDNAPELTERSPAPRQAENLRRLLLSLVSDVRVLLVKIAAVLETLRALPHQNDPQQRQRSAATALHLYAPLAHRLGLGQLKWELEDLAFRHLEPETYRRIAAYTEEKRVEREQWIEHMRQRLAVTLSEAGIAARLYGRPKHLYSIWGKMRRKQLSFDRLFDVRALRVHVDSVADCYAALGWVHTLWDPIPEEYDDYIAHPKPNGYQSLHTAVRAEDGKTLEVQIRTDEMHSRAELGVAAHWRYKEGQSGGGDPFQNEIERLRHALAEGEDTRVKVERVYVFTPRGEVLELPRGATALDMAYTLHTELGHRCRGARINGRLSPLNTPLAHADQVEILTRTLPQPRRDWADPQAGYLVSQSARNKVRAWFRARERESARHQGRELWDRTMRRLGLSREQQTRLLQALSLRSEEAAWQALGENRLTRTALLKAARALLAPGALEAEAPTIKRVDNTPGSLNLAGMQAEAAQCCRPRPGEAVIAFVTRGKGLRLHRPDCPNLRHLRAEHPERVIPVDWPGNARLPQRIDVEIWALERPDLLRDVGNVLAQYHARLAASHSHTDRRTGLLRMRMTLEIPPETSWGGLVEKIASIRDVDEVRQL